MIVLEAEFRYVQGIPIPGTWLVSRTRSTCGDPLVSHSSVTVDPAAQERYAGNVGSTLISLTPTFTLE